MLIFTLNQLKDLYPCTDGFKWYKKNIKTEDIEDILIQLNNHEPNWSRWLMVRVINLENRRRLAIFSAEQVLHIYEDKYPKDMRVRDCIQASKDYLDGKIGIEILREKRDAAYAAYAYAAGAAADAAYAAAGAAAGAAADAAADAAAADAAADAAREELQLKIIKYAVKLKKLEQV